MNRAMNGDVYRQNCKLCEGLLKDWRKGPPGSRLGLAQ
jgi:hypothetical protein